MRSKTSHSIIKLILLLIILGFSVWIVFNRQRVVDMMTVWRFTPSTAIASLATRSGMSETGKFLFYASQPQIDNKEQFNTHCHRMIEKTAVLGCYTMRRIYVYDITDPRLDGIKEVTAAHEMLHAAYDRLSDSEQARVDRLIETETAHITDPKLRERLALYEKTEPGERNNELHSIIATEIRTISPELEKYFSQYFEDRNKIVTLAESYAQVFKELEDQQTKLIQEITDLSARIDAAAQQYKRDSSALATVIDGFNKRAQNGDFTSQAAFDAERQRLISRQTKLNQTREQVNADIALYNQKKNELVAVNDTAQQLQKSINSTALPEAPVIR